VAAQLVHGNWLNTVLHRLPAPLLAALDAWSYRIAIRHRERRRLALLRTRIPARVPAPIPYTVKPWRD